MEKKDFFYFTLSFLFICSFLILSCDNLLSESKKETVSFILPDWPPSYGDKRLYPELSKWVVYTTNNLEENAIIIPNSSFLENKIIKFEVDKNKPFFVLAQPLTKNQNNEENAFFYPAGAIYPYMYMQNEDDLEMYLTWEDGYSAFLMYTIYQSAKKNTKTLTFVDSYLASFNWKKLQTTLNNKIIESVNNYEDDTTVLFYNPWLLDYNEIKKEIALNYFSLNSFNLKNSFSLQREDNKKYLSSFIPENQIIQKFGAISIKKNEDNLFSMYNSFGAIFHGSSAKNISIEYVFLPIYIEDYDKNK